jgi:hypothetical protein
MASSGTSVDKNAFFGAAAGQDQAVGVNSILNMKVFLLAAAGSGNLQVDFIEAQCTTGSDPHTQTDSEEWHVS